MISYCKELPISAEVDVVVAGAGSAGVAAAVAAARMGMKFQGKAMGKVSLFKKVDNSYLVPTDMPLVW